MGRARKTAHPAEPQIHAYVAGELDPARRTAIAEHLEDCPQCRALRRSIEGFRMLIDGTHPPGLDDLAWRRISQGVMARLESDARSPRGMIGPDVGGHGSWRVAGLVGLAVAALLVWFAPRPARQSRSPVTLSLEPHAGEPTITSVDTPFAVVLPHGLELDLGAHTRLRASSMLPTDVDVTLEVGQLDARSPAPLDAEASLRVRTPAFVACARSTDFTVGYTASESFVAVRQGSVEVEGPAARKATVNAGERRVFSPGDDGVVEPISPARTELRPEEPRPHERVSARAVPKRRSSVSETAGRALPESTAQDERLMPAQPREIVERMSVEGETRVRVVAPPVDVWADRWHEASEAYYQTRDLPRAIELASDIVEHAGVRPETELARQLLCEAYVATAQAEKAVGACALLLDHANGEEARALHYKLATLYRTQLGDCRSAIPHYTRAIVFGRASMLDDDATLWRAHCEIETGDFASARWDVSLLERRGSALARPDALSELKRRLEEVSGRR